MPFDLSSAQPVAASGSGGFDLASAKPVPTGLQKDIGDVVTGALSVPDAVINTVPRVVNLVGAGVGAAAQTLGYKEPDWVADLKGDPNVLTTGAQDIGAIQGNNPGIKGAIIRGASGAAVFPAGGVGSLVKNIALGGASGGLAQAASGSGPIASVAAGILPYLVPGAKAAAQPALNGVAEDLMQSALKPTLGPLKTGNVPAAITTMLDNGINATPGGLTKLKTMIGNLGDQVQSIIDDPANANATVNKYAVANYLKPVLDTFSKQVNAGADLDTIRSTWDQFVNHPLFQNQPADIPVTLAQQIKQGTYKQLGDSAYAQAMGTISPASVAAQKGLASGLKGEIENALPEVGPLNAQQSQLLNALKLVQRRALIEGNKNPIPLPASIAGAVHNPGMAALLWANSNALAKSLAARALYSNAAPANALTRAQRLPGRVGGYIAGQNALNK